ncbi:MAG: protein kinase [Candidatus Krumholzibacteriaceae bacterium]|jgi:tetratricopeptide (TPR) repeat protein/predicted Ser/Thr protein kinase
MKDKFISHYRLIGELGAGGMGVVYRAEDTKLGRTVALKFIMPQGIESAEERARFIHEAQAAAGLSHPNICTIHEIDEADGRLFLAMEYVDGESLEARVARGPLKIDEALDIAIQVAQGLDAAHRKSVVHRDIKPANIMIEASGLVKIMDFGLAKMSGRSKLTKAGTTLGTTAYMSPEQARGTEADHRSDIWSLGAVIYEMIAGRLPFKGDYEQAVIYSILNEAPEPLTAVRAGVPMELERIVGKALAKDPGERYQHADELIADLRALKKSLETGMASRAGTMGAMPIAASAPGAKPSKKRLAKILIPVCVAAAAVVAFVLLRPVLFGGAIATERHPVAVITFENQTGDPQYDNLKKVIPNLLITSLEQSKYIQVVTWERLRDLVKQAGKQGLEDIDADLGFELCRREKIDALVIGSFTKLGDRFVTDIKVLDVASKGSLAVAKADGRGLESIPEQVDKLSRQISRGVGLSERKIEETQRPVIDVTTSSVEAYTYFLKGRDALERLYYEEAVQNFTKAIEIDSTFAAGYLFLGKAHAAAFNVAEATRAYTKALHHAAKATERERLYINAEYAVSVRNNREEGIRIYRDLLEKYPREKYAWTFLGTLYRTSGMSREAIECDEHAIELDPTFGEALNDLAYAHLFMANYEKALEVFKRYSALCPTDANPYDSMGEAYFGMGNLDEAARMYEKAFALKPMMSTAMMLAYLSGLRGDYREALSWIEREMRLETLSGQLVVDYCWRAALYEYLGEFRQARQDARRAFAIADSTSNSDMMVVARQVEGSVLFESGRLDEARELFQARYFVPGVDFQSASHATPYRDFYLGLLDVAAGDLQSAREAAKRLEAVLPAVRADSPASGLCAANWLALLNAELFLAEGRSNDAIRCMTSDFKLHVPSVSPELFYVNAPGTQDVLARAYAAKGDLDRAITEYKRLLTFDPASKDRRLLNPRYEYRLAKLLEKRGSTAEALAHYTKVLEYWKDADPGLPELTDAKARAAALAHSGANQ